MIYSKIYRYCKCVSIPTSVKNGKKLLPVIRLVKVEIPGYVESIDYNAFAGCTSLEKIKIPDTVTEIGNGAFSGCTSLKSVVLGKKLKSMGNGVFADCESLESASFTKGNTEFIYDSGIIYSADKTIIYSMLPGYEESNYKMPSSVTQIRSNAFWGCKKLKKVQIGNNVEEIPDYAFTNCTGLEKVIFPYSLHNIDLKAFANCVNLGEIEIPISVSRIHSTAFEGCRSLRLLLRKVPMRLNMRRER